MNLFKNLMIRFGWKRITQQDVTQGVREKDIHLLRMIIQFGHFRERAAAVLGLGKVRAKNTIPEVIRLLWDDFESVAQAARQSLQVYLPDPELEYYLQQAGTYWAQKEEQRSLKRKAIWFNTNNPLQPPAPLIEQSSNRTIEQSNH